MHPDDGVLEALLDDELNSVAAGDARTHIAGCAECRSRFDALRADEVLVHQSLASLDRTAAAIPANVVIARAERSRSSLRWAAAITFLLLGAGALYAVPGSPLRQWIEASVGNRPKQGPAPTRLPAGIAVEPGARFRITFTPPPAAHTVTIAVTDGVAIDARRLDGTARFTAEMDGLLIEPGSGPGDFAIDLPRAAPWVEVLVGSRRVFLKDGPRIVTDTRPDSLGRYILNLSGR